MPLWGKAREAYKAALEEVGQKTGNILYHYTRQPDALLNVIPDVAEFSLKRGEHYKPKPALYTTENINQLPGLVGGAWDDWPGGPGFGKVRAFKELKDASWMLNEYPEFPFEQAQQKALPGGVVRAVLHPEAKIYSRTDEKLVKDHEEWLKRLYDEAGPLTDQTRRVVQEMVNDYPKMLQRSLKESRVDALKILGPDYQNPKYVSETLVFDPKKIALFWKDKYWKPWAVAGTTAAGASLGSGEEASAITPLEIAKKILKGLTGEDLTRAGELVAKAGTKAPMTRREFITGTGKAAKELIAPPLTRKEKTDLASLISGSHMRDDVWDIVEQIVSSDPEYVSKGAAKLFSIKERQYLEDLLMKDKVDPGVIKWMALRRLAPQLDKRSWTAGLGIQKKIQWEYAQDWVEKDEMPGIFRGNKATEDRWNWLRDSEESVLNYPDQEEWMKGVRKLVRQTTQEMGDPGLIWKDGKVVGFKPDERNRALLEQADKLEGILTDIAGGIQKVGEKEISRRKLLFPWTAGAVAGATALGMPEEADATTLTRTIKELEGLLKGKEARFTSLPFPVKQEPAVFKMRDILHAYMNAKEGSQLIPQDTTGFYQGIIHPLMKQGVLERVGHGRYKFNRESEVVQDALSQEYRAQHEPVKYYGDKLGIEKKVLENFDRLAMDKWYDSNLDSLVGEYAPLRQALNKIRGISGKKVRELLPDTNELAGGGVTGENEAFFNAFINDHLRRAKPQYQKAMAEIIDTPKDTFRALARRMAVNYAKFDTSLEGIAADVRAGNTDEALANRAWQEFKSLPPVVAREYFPFQLRGERDVSGIHKLTKNLHLTRRYFWGMEQPQAYEEFYAPLKYAIDTPELKQYFWNAFRSEMRDVRRRVRPAPAPANLVDQYSKLPAVEIPQGVKETGKYRYSWSEPTSLGYAGEYTNYPGATKRYLRIVQHPTEREATGLPIKLGHSAPLQHEALPTVGWFKVHDLGDTWKVEEIQGDFTRHLRDKSKALFETHAKPLYDIEGNEIIRLADRKVITTIPEKILADKGKKDNFFREVVSQDYEPLKKSLEHEKRFKDWADHGLATLLKEAKENGVPKVEIIGKQKVQDLWAGRLGDSKAIQYYRDLPKRFGFQLDENAWSSRVPALIFTAVGAGALATPETSEAAPFKLTALHKKQIGNIQKAINAERTGNILYEMGAGRFREDLEKKLLSSGMFEVGPRGKDTLPLTNMVFSELTPEELKGAAKDLEAALSQTTIKHILKDQKYWLDMAPEQFPQVVDGIIKAGHEVKMSRRDLLKLGGMPHLEPLLPELEKAGVDPKYVKVAAGILAAKYLLTPSEAEGAPPKGKAVQELATVMRKWLDDGAPFIREKGKKIRMGDPDYDKMEAIDFIAEEFKGIKTLLNEGKLGTDLETLFSPEGLVKGIEKLAGVEPKVPSPTIHLVQKEPSKKGTSKPRAEKGTTAAKPLPIKDEPLTFPDSGGKSILEEGPLRIGGKEVVDIRRGRSGARYLIFDDGTYRSTTKDRLRSLIRDRGAEIYTDIFKSRPEKQKEFQALKSANRRKAEHERDNLSLEQRYLLRDKYVKNVEGIRPERNPKEDKMLIEYQGQVMQIPRAYGEYLIKIGAAKAHKRL